jgi:hypothetical protein
VGRPTAAAATLGGGAGGATAGGAAGAALPWGVSASAPAGGVRRSAPRTTTALRPRARDMRRRKGRGAGARRRRGRPPRRRGRAQPRRQQPKGVRVRAGTGPRSVVGLRGELTGSRGRSALPGMQPGFAPGRLSAPNGSPAPHDLLNRPGGLGVVWRGSICARPTDARAGCPPARQSRDVPSARRVLSSLHAARRCVAFLTP